MTSAYIGRGDCAIDAGADVAARRRWRYELGVDEIGFPDLHHLRAADGWLELGDPVEAALELHSISRPWREHPDVLETCWRLHARMGDWNEALAVAHRLTAVEPRRASGWIHQSYSLHELRRTEEAWRLLLPQAELFPEDLTIPYNLACYACQMGELETAREWLRRAATKHDRSSVCGMALQDPDLEPLRDFLTQWDAS